MRLREIGGGMTMKLARREFFAVAAGAAALAGGAHSAAAALYPERPIRLVLPFPPGGVFDIVGRPWADKVRRALVRFLSTISRARADRSRRSLSRMRRPTATRFFSAAPRSISPR
jgi:hypothetical protein